MSHPHDALLQAHLDGELEPLEMREVTRHLSLCDACRRASVELEKLGYQFSEMIGRLDETEPAEWRAAAAPLPAAPALVVHHGSGPLTAARPRPVLGRTATRARSHMAWRWAAAALLTVTSVAAAAVVRGPLFHGSSPTAATAGTALPAAAPATLTPAGAIAIAPHDGTAEVSLTDAAPGSRLHVIVTSATELTVSVRADSASAEPARFRTSDSRIAVRLPSTHSLVEVAVPATTHDARILVDGSTVAVVRDGSVSPAAAAVDGIELGTRR